jgi:hypothetical protein
MPRLFLLAALAALAAPPPAAQPSYGAVDERQTNVGAYFFHVLPGEPTITVSVWGAVAAPGLYEVGEATDLGTLLSLAGGPAGTPEQEDRHVTTTVRLFRTAGPARQLAYEAVVDRLVLEPGRYPALHDGDLVEVETAIEEVGRFTWQDALTIVTGGVAAVVLAVERVASLF